MSQEFIEFDENRRQKLVRPCSDPKIAVLAVCRGWDRNAGREFCFLFFLGHWIAQLIFLHIPYPNFCHELLNILNETQFSWIPFGIQEFWYPFLLPSSSPSVCVSFFLFRLLSSPPLSLSSTSIIQIYSKFLFKTHLPDCINFIHQVYEKRTMKLLSWSSLGGY